MIRIRCVILFCSGIVLLSTCKDHDVAPVPAETRIVRIIYQNGPSNGEWLNTDTISFKYDDQFRLIEEKHSSSDRLLTYSYEDSLVTETASYPSGQSYDFVYHLNQKGLWSEQDYDDDGHVTGPAEGAFVIRVVNGNTVYIKNPTEETTYSFYDSTINTTGNEYRGKSFLGKDDANLLRRWYHVQLGDYDVSYLDYTYEVDDKRRVTKSTATGWHREIQQVFYNK